MMTKMNYYLGVKSIPDAANAINELSFMKVVDVSTLVVQNSHIDRIALVVGPASKDNDLSKGLMICISGSFTSEETDEIEKLSRLADQSVTAMVAKFVAKQVADMSREGKSGLHKILGQSSPAKVEADVPVKKWWEIWK